MKLSGNLKVKFCVLLIEKTFSRNRSLRNVQEETVATENGSVEIGFGTVQEGRLYLPGAFEWTSFSMTEREDKHAIDDRIDFISPHSAHCKRTMTIDMDTPIWTRHRIVMCQDDADSSGRPCPTIPLRSSRTCSHLRDKSDLFRKMQFSKKTSSHCYGSTIN